MTVKARATIGVIGGSGLYELLEDAQHLRIDTPYGQPSAEIAVGRFAGASVAFLARHGTDHSLAPHRVPYRANIWALASLGVRAIVASSAVGGLSPDLAPDTFVVPDQLIDRTRGRDDTFYDRSDVQHLGFADPFCPVLRQAAVRALTVTGERFASTGTTMVIPGPRFSTRAESAGWRLLGADLVNMTQYPESALAAELNLGYVALSFVTDSDTGHKDGDEVVSADAVFRRLAAAVPRIRAAIAETIVGIPSDYPLRALVASSAVAAVLARS